MHRLRRLAAGLLLTSLFAWVLEAQSQRSPSEAELSVAVSEFLTTWLVQGKIDATVAYFARPELLNPVFYEVLETNDESFEALPLEFDEPEHIALGKEFFAQLRTYRDRWRSATSDQDRNQIGFESFKFYLSTWRSALGLMEGKTPTTLNEAAFSMEGMKPVGEGLRPIPHGAQERFDLTAIQTVHALKKLYVFDERYAARPEIREMVEAGDVYLAGFKHTSEHVTGPLLLWTRENGSWKLMSMAILTW